LDLVGYICGFTKNFDVILLDLVWKQINLRDLVGSFHTSGCYLSEKMKNFIMWQKYLSKSWTLYEHQWIHSNASAELFSERIVWPNVWRTS
jgi:hypothetical protein